MWESLIQVADEILVSLKDLPGVLHEITGVREEEVTVVHEEVPKGLKDVLGFLDGVQLVLKEILEVFGEVP